MYVYAVLCAPTGAKLFVAVRAASPHKPEADLFFQWGKAESFRFRIGWWHSGSCCGAEVGLSWGWQPGPSCCSPEGTACCCRAVIGEGQTCVLRAFAPFLLC